MFPISELLPDPFDLLSIQLYVLFQSLFVFVSLRRCLITPFCDRGDSKPYLKGGKLSLHGT